MTGMAMTLKMSLCAGAAALILAAPATAQLSSKGGPISVSSDRTESLERENKVFVVGNVDIEQGDARLRADKVTLLFSGNGADTGGITGGFGDIKSMVAEGNVFYITPDLKATGDRGVYDQVSDIITLTGNVSLLRDKDVAKGNSMRLELATGKSTLDGGGGRVKMFIEPSGNGQ